MLLCLHRNGRLSAALCGFLLCLVARLPAAEVRILDSGLTGDRRFLVQPSAVAGHYFILLDGPDPAAVNRAVDVAPAAASPRVLGAPANPAGTAFFRVHAVPVDAPVDSDGDGMDDLFELERAPLLNPLDAADGPVDSDGDGATNFEEYLRGTEPGVPDGSPARLTLSPSNGEADVAVTRETVVYFSVPLATNAVLNTTMLRAEFGGRRMLSRVELSSDRRKASIFYLETLPGSARVNVIVEGDQLRNAAGVAVDADGDGVAGGQGRFFFDTVNLTPAPNTVVVGQVFASELVPGPGGGSTNRPLPGVTITVDGREQELRATTDAEGRFTLSPAPAGTFFVHVDGRTSPLSQWRTGAYYPSVGKAWEAAAGQTNLAGGTGTIYLPLISAQALQSVSATEPTPITFAPDVLAQHPELAGVEITIPPNALFNDAGTRGGRVGIAPVAPDRLPEPLPPGLDLGLVITVQTDGPQNFDRPVPVRFPNTPDPATGQPLPPGAKSALWSFNHDTGRWEIVGPMTVTADGRFVETDPGVGLLQPGWHGQRQGTSGSAPPGPPPPDFCDKVAEYALGSTLGCAGGKALAGALKGAGGMVIDAVGSTLPGEGVVAIIAGSAGTYIVREGTFGDPGGSITDAIQFEKICCACLAKFGVVDSLGCGSVLPQSVRSALRARRQLASAGLHQGAVVSQAPLELLRFNAIAALEAATARFVTNALRHLDLVTLGRALAGGATNDAQVSPAVLGELQAIQAQLLALPGGARPAPFYLGLLGAIQDAETKVMELFNITGAGPALYRLDNLNTGTTQRGKTDARGGLGDLILAPNNNYRLTRLDLATLIVAVSEFASADTGRRTVIPRGFWLRDDAAPPDADNDGLDDVAEGVVGTNPAKADTDNDGLSDAFEVQNASDPLGGLFVATGVIGGADTPGTAVDICVQGNTAMVADGAAGVTLFDIRRPQQPVALAQVDTPGYARAVACAGDFVFVADGAAGLAILDVGSPAAARVTRSIGFGAEALAVTAVNGLAVVGLADGRIIVVDPGTGRVNAVANAGARVSDLVVADGVLWAATQNALASFALLPGADRLVPQGSAPLQFFPEGITGRRRLFVADGRAFVTSYPGYEVFDVANPLAPVRRGDAVDRGPNSFKQIVPNGGGLGVAAVGVNPRDDGTQDVSLYDVRQDAATTNFLATLPTPGIAHALALHRGLAFVADGAAGLQVVNYLAADTAGQPPTVSIVSPPGGAGVEEGSTLVFRVQAADDVQVRNVELYVDGAVLADDGAYPFQTSLVVPTLASGRSNLVLRARAFDTGGNATWTPVITVVIGPDVTPPVVTYVTPADGGIVGELGGVRATFDEPLAPGSVSNALRVWRLGTNETLLPGELPSGPPVPGLLRAEGRFLLLSFTNVLPAGDYLAQIESAVTDLAGNRLAAPFRWRFLAQDFIDQDGDGVEDTLEASLGLSPGSADTDGDGILDGDEDRDGDGVPNAWERLLGADPANPRSLDPTRLDGEVDTDLDGLSDWREVRLGTNRGVPDTDGDGWPDGAEVELLTKPGDPQSVPRLFDTRNRAELFIFGPSDPVFGGGRVPVTPAVAPILFLPGTAGNGGFGGLPVTPSVAPTLLLPGRSADGAFGGLPFSLPPVTLRIAQP
ncbi:MAG: Ig-like domain-containing protein [Limisphaerales bacterium]